MVPSRVRAAESRRGPSLLTAAQFNPLLLSRGQVGALGVVGFFNHTFPYYSVASSLNLGLKSGEAALFLLLIPLFVAILEVIFSVRTPPTLRLS